MNNFQKYMTKNDDSNDNVNIVIRPLQIDGIWTAILKFSLVHCEYCDQAFLDTGDM